MIDGEEVLKDYDAALMRRLLRYLRPYKPAVALAMCFLILSTAGEMILPVLIQAAVDDNILPYHRRLESGGLTAAQTRRFERRDPLGEGTVFLPESRLSVLSVSHPQIGAVVPDVAEIVTWLGRVVLGIVPAVNAFGQHPGVGIGVGDQQQWPNIAIIANLGVAQCSVRLNVNVRFLD